MRNFVRGKGHRPASWAVALACLVAMESIGAVAIGAEAPALQATLIVHTDQPVAVIDPDIYGQFAEHLGQGIYGGLWVGKNSPIPNTRGFRNDVVRALRELGVPVVRWPGGCFADQYHWRDGIGPQGKRPVRVNVSWGGVEETNAVGTHEIMDLMEMLGSKIYLDTNVGTGSPQETKDWLEYMTSPTHSALAEERRRNGRKAPWRVDYLGFGNEAWGCGGHMRPETYSDLYHRFATYAITPVSGVPKRLAAGGYDGDTTWTEALLAGDKAQDIDAITLHHYALPTGDWKIKGAATGFGEDQWISTMHAALDLDRDVAAHAAVMDKYDPEKRVALDIDEWGNWYDVARDTNPGFLRQQNTLRDAVTAALNFNIFHAHADRVRMANIAQMANVLQALVLTDGARMVLTPTYYAFMIYKPFRGATALGAALSVPDYRYDGVAVPALSASAAREPDSAIAIALVNLAPHIRAHVAIVVPARTVSGVILTADAMDAHNTFDAPDTVVPAAFHEVAVVSGGLTVDIPAKSVVVLEVNEP